MNEANQEEVAPLTEEEQTARIHAIDSGPKKDAPPARIGIGPRPCFCCGSDAHSWIQCPKKVSGKCGVCGSQEHPTFRCYKKFNPAPSARVNCVVSLLIDQIPEGITVCETQPSGRESALPTTPADPCLAPEVDVRVNHAKVAETLPDPLPGPTIRVHQATLKEAVSHDALSRTNIRKELDHVSELVPTESREVRPEERIPPLINPDKTGLLYYAVSYQGHPCATLLDCGASHSFLSADWLRKKEIPTQELKNPLSISVFDGPSQQAIKRSCHIVHVTLGTLDVPWTFMVVTKARPHAILGLDFMRAYCLCYDPRTDALITQGNPVLSGKATSTKGTKLKMTEFLPATVEIDHDPPSDTMLTHVTVPNPNWASGALLNNRGDRISCELSPSGDCIMLCSVTADS